MGERAACLDQVPIELPQSVRVDGLLAICWHHLSSVTWTNAGLTRKTAESFSVKAEIAESNHSSSIQKRLRAVRPFRVSARHAA